MNKRNPIVILLALLVLVATYFAFTFSTQKKREFNLRVQKETELSQKIVELADKTTALENLQIMKADTEKRLQQNIAELEANVRASQEQIQYLTTTTEALTNEKTELQSQIAEKQKNIEELSRRLGQYETDRSDLLADLQKLKTGDNSSSSSLGDSENTSAPELLPAPVNLGNIIVQKASGKAAKVESINSEFGFIVVNAGAKDGLKLNSVIHVVHNGKFVGSAVIQKVRNNLAAATLITESLRGSVTVGDLVSIAP